VDGCNRIDGTLCGRVARRQVAVDTRGFRQLDLIVNMAFAIGTLHLILGNTSLDQSEQAVGHAVDAVQDGAETRVLARC